MDSSHPIMATKVSGGWIGILTAMDKPVETTGSRTRLNIVGEIALWDLENAIPKQYATVNGEWFIDFFKLINEQYKADMPINFILDCVGYHRRKLVRKEARKRGIKLHYLPSYSPNLPSYSPNLNPIERLLKIMNEYASYNKYFATGKECWPSTDEFLDDTLPYIWHALTSKINDNLQLFNFS